MGLIDRVRGRRRMVHMLFSVSDPAGSFVAGEDYFVPRDLSDELADKFVANSWAEGSLSREYADHELPALRGSQQTVAL